MPRFAVNHYLCPPGVSLGEFAGVVADAGFDGIGLTQAAVSEAAPSALRSLLSDRGLNVSSVNTSGFFLGQDAQQARCNERLLATAAALEAPALNVIVGAADASTLLETARAQAEDALAAFAAQARKAGVQLLVEPLWMSNAFTKSCFNSISHARQVFSRIPGLKLNLDYYHLWCDPDLGDTLRGQGCPVGLLQICDVDWADTPNQAVRAPLGEGRLNVLTQLQALQQAPGDYPVELELFINQHPGRDYAALIRDAARQLRL